MAQTTESKVDIAFKKLVDVDPRYWQNAYYEDPAGGGFIISTGDIWFDTVPETPPVATTDVIKVWTSGGDGRLTLTEDTTIPNEQGWYAYSGDYLRNFVPPKYGIGYVVKLYDANDNQIYTTDDMDWFFDYKSGRLIIQDTHTYTTPFKIDAYQYIGSTVINAIDSFKVAVDGDDIPEFLESKILSYDDAIKITKVSTSAVTDPIEISIDGDSVEWSPEPSGNSNYQNVNWDDNGATYNYIGESGIATLRPNGDGNDYSNWSQVPNSGSKYEKADDEHSDEGNTYIEAGTDDSKFYIDCHSGGEYLSTVQTALPSWDYYSYQWNVDPATSIPWIISGVNDLGIGIKQSVSGIEVESQYFTLPSLSIPVNSTIQYVKVYARCMAWDTNILCTQLYAEVAYATPTPTSFKIAIKELGGAEVLGTTETLSNTAYTTVSEQWSTKPSSGAWTKTDLENLQIGYYANDGTTEYVDLFTLGSPPLKDGETINWIKVYAKARLTDDSSGIRVTYVYAEVNHGTDHEYLSFDFVLPEHGIISHTEGSARISQGDDPPTIFSYAGALYFDATDDILKLRNLSGETYSWIDIASLDHTNLTNRNVLDSGGLPPHTMVGGIPINVSSESGSGSGMIARLSYNEDLNIVEVCWEELPQSTAVVITSYDVETMKQPNSVAMSSTKAYILCTEMASDGYYYIYAVDDTNTIVENIKYSTTNAGGYESSSQTYTGICYVTDGTFEYLYVSQRGTDKVLKIDVTAEHALYPTNITTLTVGDQPEGIVTGTHLTGGGYPEYVFVANSNTNTISRITVSDDTVESISCQASSAPSNLFVCSGGVHDGKIVALSNTRYIDIITEDTKAVSSINLGASPSYNLFNGVYNSVNSKIYIGSDYNATTLKGTVIILDYYSSAWHVQNLYNSLITKLNGGGKCRGIAWCPDYSDIGTNGKVYCGFDNQGMTSAGSKGGLASIACDNSETEDDWSTEKISGDGLNYQCYRVVYSAFDKRIYIAVRNKDYVSHVSPELDIFGGSQPTKSRPCRVVYNATLHKLYIPCWGMVRSKWYSTILIPYAVHSPISVTDSDTIDFTLVGQGLTAELSHLGIEDLVDPDANALMGWDDTDGMIKFIAIGDNLTYTHSTHTLSATGGSGVTDAQYVTLVTHSGLSAERVLTGTSNQITITDNGANGTVVLSLPQSINIGADVVFKTLKLSGNIGILETGGDPNTHYTYFSPGGDQSADITYVLPIAQASGAKWLLNTSGTWSWADLTSASTTVAGIVELAIASEVTTGTSTTLAVTPDALAGSTIFGVKACSIESFFALESGLVVAQDVLQGDGCAYIVIPQALNGMNLIRANACVITAGTTNATTITLKNITDGHEMLSGAISIASGATVGTPGTIDTGEDDVVTNDVIAVNCDSVSTTKPKGLITVLEFALP